MRSILTRGNIPNMTHYLVGPPSALMTAATRQPPILVPGSFLRGAGLATTLLLFSAPPFQLPEAIEAFFQSLRVLVGMLSSLETWIGQTPDFRRVRGATSVELLQCSCLGFVIVIVNEFKAKHDIKLGILYFSCIDALL